MTPGRAALSLVLLLAAAPARAEGPSERTGARAEEPSERIGGHEEAWWRERHEELAAQLEHAGALVEECEESEAPRAYHGVGGYAVRGRDGRIRWVEVKRCDEQRASLIAARGALDRFEERARRAGVPPGWLR